MSAKTTKAKRSGDQPQETLDASSLTQQAAGAPSSESGHPLEDELALSETIAPHDPLSTQATISLDELSAREDISLDETLAPGEALSSPRTPTRLQHRLRRGDSLGHFEVLRELGSGGMGTVYEAFNHTLNRRVALKILHVKDGASLDTLKQEARAIAQLEHPNIVQVYHLGEIEHLSSQALYIEMQLVSGKPLHSLIERGSLGFAQRFNILSQILSALSHAHERGVVHRDIKPDNVIVTHEGVVKLIDFGISTSLKAQGDAQRTSRSGTPAYMAPEVWQEGEWSVQSDLYAFGVSAYWMLSGSFPFRFPDHGGWQGVMETHLKSSPEPLQTTPPLPVALSKLLSSCLEKDPARRPRSARDLNDEIERLQEELNGVAPPDEINSEPTAWFKLFSWVSQHRLALLTSLALSILSLLSLTHGPLKHLDDDALDLLQSLQVSPQERPVGLIGLDEATYVDPERHMNPSSLAKVVDGLLQQGVKAVGVDLIQDKPSIRELRIRDIHWQQVVTDPRLVIALAPIDAEVGAQRSVWHSTEDALRKKHGIQLLFDQKSPDPTELDLTAKRALKAKERGLKQSEGVDEYLPLAYENTASEAYTDLSLKRVRERYMRINSASSLILPYPELLEATHALGHLRLKVDPDGVIRRAPLLLRYKDKVFPSLGLLVAMRTLGAGLQDLNYIQDTLIISPPGQSPIYIPVNRSAEMSLKVRGTPLERVNHSLLEFTQQLGPLAPPALKARAYILGSTAKVAGDWGTISHWRHTPKGYAHLIVAENILNQDFIYPVRFRWLLALSLLLSLSTFAIALKSKAEWGLLITLLSLTGTASIGLWVLHYLNRELPLVTITSLVLTSNILAMTIKALRSRQAQRELTSRLGEALPPRVAQAIIKGRVAPSRLIKPQRRLVTLVCVQISPLDELSEQLSPKALTSLLNELSDQIQRLAIEYGGLMVPSQRASTHVAFLRASAKQGSSDALRFSTELRAHWTQGLWRWKKEQAEPTLSVVIGQGRCAWGTLGITRTSELSVQGVFVQRLEELTSLAVDQTLIMGDVIQELEHEERAQRLHVTLKPSEKPTQLLVLSPGPSPNAPLSEGDKPLTCYYLTASHHGA